jgi:CheY-like chemotaxis protein
MRRRRSALLLVDDDQPLHDLVGDAPAHGGDRVLTANDGRAALAAVARQEPYPVLPDMRSTTGGARRSWP